MDIKNTIKSLWKLKNELTLGLGGVVDLRELVTSWWYSALAACGGAQSEEEKLGALFYTSAHARL